MLVLDHRISGLFNKRIWLHSPWQWTIGTKMTQMHEDEFPIDAILVRRLLDLQCSQWAHLQLEKVISSGTDHALFRLGTEFVIRLPRLDGAVNNINKEWEWLPKLAPFLKIPISIPLFKGSPTDFYPWPWIVSPWHQGSNPPFEKENEYEQLAKDMASFLNEFHKIPLADGPYSRRGVPLKTFDEETRNAIHQLDGKIDTEQVTKVWEYFLGLPYWQNMPVWVHGDLLPGNILIENNRLSAIIDFSDVGIGDPACDLIMVWSLFNKQSRNVFRKYLHEVDDQTWQRGQGLALSIALIILPYYWHTNPGLVCVAKNMLKSVLAEMP